jgi:CheY-like chemotaxis protein
MMWRSLGGRANVGKTILLVDDQADVRRILERMLHSLGFAVLSVGSGAEALDSHRDHDGPIELLITDLEMPGMDGRQLAEELRRHRPGIGVLFLSGHLEDVTDDAEDDADPGHYLQKPCTMKELSERVTRLLETPPES